MPFFKGKKIKTFKIFCKILPLKSHLARKAETNILRKDRFKFAQTMIPGVGWGYIAGSNFYIEVHRVNLLRNHLVRKYETFV